MTLSLKKLEEVEQHWAVQSIPVDLRSAAFKAAEESLVKSALGPILKEIEPVSPLDISVIERVATAYELAAIEGLSSVLNAAPDEELKGNVEAGAYHAFGLCRVLPLPSAEEQRIFHVLHMAGLAYCSDRWTDLKRWFHDMPASIVVPSVADVSWDRRLLFRLYDCWVRLLRKNSWDDLDQVAEIISGLRNDQAELEAQLIGNTAGLEGKAVALRLVSLYHLAKATEQLAVYMLQGEPVAINAELDQHFEAASKAANSANDSQLEMIMRWLHATSRKMVSGSVWWVAHTVNSRVTRFVSHLTKHRSMFELLPPQRAALQEQGLLDPASRAIVVDMPTSGGKTQLAQFRMLQALNQFDQDDGWVAYVAPTRALVSQLTRRLRSDFSPLGIHVEQLVGAIEIDAFEDDILTDANGFHVLVSTPEKLQLVLRNKKVIRPLALVVVDEAHNIEDEARGLRIELLLSSIKQEHATANFLLLMPFVPNSQELSQWLAGDSGRAISLGTTAWQPNERVVGMFYTAGRDIEKDEKPGDWHLLFETLTTTQRTIDLHGKHEVDGVRPLGNLNFSTVRKSLSAQAVAMAKAFSKRGASIAIAQKIPDVWSIARKVASELEVYDPIPEDVSLVQRFLETEISPEFELVNMLGKGVVVHHAGLPAEALALIEWLTESGHVRVMCATTTIAQGLNFPIASVFLATTKYPYGVPMSHRAFWNLAGRAGRIGQDSIGVVGIAAGNDPNAVRQYVSSATGSLISRMEILLDELYEAGQLQSLQEVIKQDQWADYRSYIAHLWNEKRNLDAVISEAEQTLRNTFGFGVLRSKNDGPSLQKAEALLEATRGYVRVLAEHPENATLADATGFSPEGVRTALIELGNLEGDLTLGDWTPSSLFGDRNDSTLPDLMGVMMKIPQLKSGLQELAGDGIGFRKLSNITQDWVLGNSLAEIANTYFEGDDFTNKISRVCKAVYRDLANNAAWGLSALSKMPTAGIDFENMSEDDRRMLNNLPAMLYHGVKTEEAVLMRMNSVPRTVAEAVGVEFKEQVSKGRNGNSKGANEFIDSLQSGDWSRFRPTSASMSGSDYRRVWKTLSGN